MFAEFMTEYGWHIVGLIVTALVTVIVEKLSSRLACALDTTEKKKIAQQVVMFVEQVCKGIHGEEKLQHALESAEALLKERGIPFDAMEMRVMIESALAELNKVFEKEKEELEAAEHDDETAKKSMPVKVYLDENEDAEKG